MMLNERFYKSLALPVFALGYWGTAIAMQGVNYETVKWAATSLMVVSLGTMYWLFQFGESPIETAEHIICPVSQEGELHG